MSRKRERSGEDQGDVNTEEENRNKTAKTMTSTNAMDQDAVPETITLDPKLTIDEKLNVLFKQNCEILKELKTSRSENLYLKGKLDDQEARIQQLERKLDLLDMKARERNVILKGIKVTDKKQVNRQVIEQLKKSIPKSNIQLNAKVVGQYGSTVIAEIYNYRDRELLFKNTAKLKNNGIRIYDDLPPRLRDAKNALLKKRRELINNGTKGDKIKVTNYALVVNGTDWYDWDPDSGETKLRGPKPNKSQQ